MPADANPTQSGLPPTVSIVVPTYHEAENLPELFQRIAAAMRGAGLDYEIVVVDDNSRDGTDAAAKAAVDAGLPVRLLVRETERGLSSAVVHGFQHARGQWLLCMDADLSHPPERIPDLLRALTGDGGETGNSKLETGLSGPGSGSGSGNPKSKIQNPKSPFPAPPTDFVIGSRYVPGAGTDENWGLLRWLNSRIATLLARPFTRARDPMAGFFALSRSTFEGAAALSPLGYKIGLELLVKCRCQNVAEVPIHFADRKRGQSKLSLREQLNYIRHLKRLADFKFGWFSRFVQFGAVGSSGVLVDLAAYAFFLKVQPSLVAARAVAIWIAMTWNFWLNRHLTFSHSRHREWLPQYAGFAASCAFGALVNLGLSTLLVKHTQVFATHVFLAAIVGILAGTAVNFYLSFKHVFKHHHTN